MSPYSQDRGYQAFRILQLTFIIAPLLAGLDKFFNLLTHWPQYLSPLILQLINYHDRELMLFAGLIEIIAGLGVWWKPKIFSYIVALWLLGIIINLVSTGLYFDIALRDFGLFLSAIALARLSAKYA